MSISTDSTSRTESELQQMARDHLWLHFSRQSVMTEGPGVPIIVKGEGHRIWDSAGKQYIDGLAGLFVVNAGHGRRRLAEAGARQAEQLAFFPIWSYAHPAAIELADRIADLAPGDLNHVFFSTGGGEAVETAFKLAKHYWKLVGKPTKHKVISRYIAYHGTPQGALAITGLPGMKSMFEPVTPGGFRVPNTNYYRAGEMGFTGSTEEEFGVWAADRIEEMINFEGPDTVAAVFLEPVQNSGGCFPPPPGYFQRVREICDKYDVLLVSDEVICAFGRLGQYFGADVYGFQPDMITFAKAVTSGYSPLGGTIVSDRVYEPFAHGHVSFPHGYTFGGHPVSAAVALENLDIFEEEGLLAHVRENSPVFRSTLEKLTDLPIVGDVRGDGYFFGIELVKDKTTKETFDDDESERLLRGLPVEGSVRRGPVLPRRRPRGSGHPARSAPHDRPGRVRPDRADPARRPDGGVDPSVTRQD